MTERYVDTAKLRRAMDQLYDLGTDMAELSHRMDQDPIHLVAGDWGDLGGSEQEVFERYEAIRKLIRKFVKQGGAAFDTLGTELGSAIARMEDTEASHVARIKKLERDEQQIGLVH